MEALKQQTKYYSSNNGLMDTIAETGENSFEDTVMECFEEPGVEKTDDVSEEMRCNVAPAEMETTISPEVKLTTISPEVKSTTVLEVKSLIPPEVKPLIAPENKSVTTEVKPATTEVKPATTETKPIMAPEAKHTVIQPTTASKPIKPVAHTTQYPLKKATDTTKPATRYPTNRLPPKPVMPYQQRRQMYNSTLRTPSHPIVTPRAPVTTSRPAKPAEPVKRNVIIGSSRLAPKTSAPQHASSVRPVAPSNPSHTTSPAPTTTTRVPRSGGTLPSYMRDTAASRAKQVTTPIVMTSQRSAVRSTGYVDG